MDYRKRGRPQLGFKTNGGFKKSKHEKESFSTGVGSKSKPCTKFFSTTGCPFGESCHFLHYVPGGYNAISQMMNIPPAVHPATRKMAPQLSMMNGSSAPSAKTKICNRYNSAEGCKFGDKCHYAHGEWELGKQADTHDSHDMGPIHGRFGGPMVQPPPGPALSFGASATAKISIDASLAGAIIGKGGINSKQICRQTGAKLAIREHESDTNLRNIELEGTFEQIKDASAMVRELIENVSMRAPHKTTTTTRMSGRPPPLGSNFRTKPCDNFAKGRCTFGDRCHFAHGVTELRNS